MNASSLLLDRLNVSNKAVLLTGTTMAPAVVVSGACQIVVDVVKLSLEGFDPPVAESGQAGPREEEHHDTLIAKKRTRN